jgi:group I intron endonuclease
MRHEIISGIYCFENLVNGKRYIGQSKDILRRLQEHEVRLLRGVDKSTNLQRAVDKYGIGNFRFSILEECICEELNEREIYWISAYQSNDRRYGYNISPGGDRSLEGYNHSDETRRKLSEMKKGSRLSEEHKRKISIGNKGKVMSDESRAKMSKAQSRENHPMWGRSHSDETKQRMSDAHSGERAHQFGRKKAGSSSQYLGVRKLVQKGFVYWQAGIKLHQKEIYIGMSKDKIEAARMYDAYVIENNLPNPLNFPE